jgi:hypothetical protein
MMRIPAQWHEFAEFVRRALHDAADDIEPSEDGLEPIRARIPAWSGLRDRQAARRRRRPPARRSARHGGPGPQQNRS